MNSLFVEAAIKVAEERQEGKYELKSDWVQGLGIAIEDLRRIALPLADHMRKEWGDKQDSALFDMFTYGYAIRVKEEELREEKSESATSL